MPHKIPKHAYSPSRGKVEIIMCICCKRVKIDGDILAALYTIS